MRKDTINKDNRQAIAWGRKHPLNTDGVFYVYYIKALLKK